MPESYWKSTYLDQLGSEAIAAIVRYGRERSSVDALIALWHIKGGAAARVGPEAMAFGDRDVSFLLSFDTSWTDAADTECNIAWTRAAWADMRRFGPGGMYLNFAGFGEKEALVRAGYGVNNGRLAALKARYDPGNLFRINQNVRPTV